MFAKHVPRKADAAARRNKELLSFLVCLRKCIVSGATGVITVYAPKSTPSLFFSPINRAWKSAEHNRRAIHFAMQLPAYVITKDVLTLMFILLLMLHRHRPIAGRKASPRSEMTASYSILPPNANVALFELSSRRRGRLLACSKTIMF